MRLKFFFPSFTLTWRVNNYVSRQRKGINWRNERNLLENKIPIFVNQLTVDNWETSFLPERVTFPCTLELGKIRKISQCSLLLNIFPSKDGNVEKQAKVDSCFKRNARGTT